MRRRDLLVAGGALLSSLAGCAGTFETRPALSPPLVEDRPDAPYVPTHVEGMAMAGKQTAGPYACALTYTYPHRFWLVTGTRTKKVGIESDDSVHLMPLVWDRRTGVVPPDLNPQVTVTEGGESVASMSPWPMLSQPMGFHFGDNVKLGGSGTFRVTVEVGEPSIRRAGSLADNRGRESFDFEFAYESGALEDVSYRDVPADEEGRRGTVDPMAMDTTPDGRLPAPDALPGEPRGVAEAGETPLAVTTLSDATPFGGGESEVYLAVSPRTPHNEFPLPLAGLSATLDRGGETVFAGDLSPALAPGLGHHYGAAVSGVRAGDDLTVSVDTPPQVARHEGYETAFFDLPAATLTL
jgi:hypothetical protein